ncbi:hypothetical protein GTY41_02500 [Streptomyces sp. SID685]|uniref:hypothetical protein n=1 Tax=Streptomyces sp. SID685 TaxID=2690322 RepID=UPI0013705D03|nr:hypothetical protein [Streptomyces sp. SID685]MYR83844.1 hypothetical protein [Streptomyces sp. SID685]
MSTVSHFNSHANHIVIVAFPEALKLDPLTTRRATLATDVELYLRRREAAAVTVTVETNGRTGAVHSRGRLITTFSVRPLGAAVQGLVAA